MASNDVSLTEAKSCFTLRQLDTGTYAITGYDAIKCGKEVNVPSSVDGKQVTLIDENAFKGKGLTKVTLYYGITEIGYSAFQNNAITELKLSSSIKKIADFAFLNNRIENLVLPEGVEYIGNQTFRMNRIKSISFPKSLKTIASLAFSSNQLTEVNLNSSASIGGGAFANNLIEQDNAYIYAKNSDGSTNYSKIIAYMGESKAIVIPSKKNGVKLTTIGSYAFGWVGLTSVVIPDSVITIESGAFAANNLNSISLPNNLRTIGNGAFNRNAITKFNIPNSVTSIGDGAFNVNCDNTNGGIVYKRNSDGTWDYSTIVGASNGNCGLKSLVIPAVKNGVKLKSISSSAFSSLTYTSITMPNIADCDPTFTVADNAFYNNRLPGNDKWMYQIKNGKVDYSYLSSYAGNGSGNLVIPEIGPNNTPLKTIAASFAYKSYSSYTVPKSVQVINNGVFPKNGEGNQQFNKIINKTGRAFNWNGITSSSYSSSPFVSGIVHHQAGDVEISIG